MAFTANPYDQTGTLDTIDGGADLDNITQAGSGGYFPDDTIELGPNKSISSIVPAFTDEDLQTHSDDRLQVDQIIVGSPY